MSDTLAQDRFQRQLAFIVEIDKLKTVLRRTMLTDQSRRENSAEHSWHIALMAVLLHEHAGEAVDLMRVIKMLLVHDIVEIDAGDTFAYDATGRLDKEERERRAADRLFALLPDDHAQELRSLWDEFEENRSPEACFANALDRLQPLLQNLHSKGGTWRSHGITLEQVIERMQPIQNACPAIWPWVEDSLRNVWVNGKVREPWD
jgi:putative hydrolase of HD superfamily